MIILDGAMGTLLQKSGMKAGERSEVFGFEHPEILKKIHSDYVKAGSEIVYADTFGANRRKLSGTGYSVRQIIRQNVLAAKESGVKTALDIGPIGELIEPLGSLSMDEAYDIYREMIVAGTEAGADIIAFETQMSLGEVRMGVLAAKENSNLPVWVTMTFEKNGRTFTGTDIKSFAITMEAIGVDAVGINCSLGPREIIPLINELRKWTSLPIIAKPNAGLPDPVTGEYSLQPDDFALYMQQLAENGATAIGGCCGTDPEYIEKIAVIKECGCVNDTQKNGCCSQSRAVEFGSIIVVGERINPTGKKKLQQALKEGNLDYIVKNAIEQEASGADVLDINVGTPGIDEAVTMKQVVQCVQNSVGCPLQIDSASPAAIEAGLRYYNGVAIVNSVNGDDNKLDSILPLVKKYGAYVIGLTMDESGIPKTADERLEIARKILKRAEQYGISHDRVIIDCLTLTISAEQSQAVETLNAIKKVKSELGLKCTLGVSNISYGLPERDNITTAFLIAALNSGLDIPIINPNITEIMDAIYSYKVINGEDINSKNYIQRFNNSSQVKDEKMAEITIEKAVVLGLPEEVTRIVGEELNKKDALSVINDMLIPALDVVGEKYEKQEIFLPQLISAANAAGAGFTMVRESFGKDDAVNKGTVILATVEGDIHDIGKNIVKVVMENYGYRIIDLGRDVPPEIIVEAAIKDDVKLIGLSALMTTTVGAMEKTISMIKESGHKCQVMTGGAVLTEEFAKKIGADYYVKDAMSSVNVAKMVFGDYDEQ